MDSEKIISGKNFCYDMNADFLFTLPDENFCDSLKKKVCENLEECNKNTANLKNAAQLRFSVKE